MRPAIFASSVMQWSFGPVLQHLWGIWKEEWKLNKLVKPIDKLSKMIEEFYVTGDAERVVVNILNLEIRRWDFGLPYGSYDELTKIAKYAVDEWRDRGNNVTVTIIFEHIAERELLKMKENLRIEDDLLAKKTLEFLGE